MEKFDPSAAGVSNGNYFGFPYTTDESNVIIVSVPWDATTSYKPGTALAPDAMIEASVQLDFFDFDVNEAWKIGHATHPINNDILSLSKKTRLDAEVVINHLESGGNENDDLIADNIKAVNEASYDLNEYVYQTTKSYLLQNKLIALVGGEHSVPFGYVKALSEIHSNFGILHIDAHADLRNSFEGFKYSHASIMHNILDIDQVTNLTQVAIRDVSKEEVELAESNDKIKFFSDQNIKEKLFNDESWDSVCSQIIESLPQKVYISFDIDGLSPDNCPNTGTPVPGGLSFDQALYLMKKLANSNRQIIGFDICEVGPSESEWDQNVGARLLYKVSNLMYKTNSNNR